MATLQADVMGTEPFSANRSLPMKDCPELRTALEQANLHTLLMVYVHLTHDESMLETFKVHIHPPYTNPDYRIPQDCIDDLREKLLHILTTPGAARDDDPALDLMQKMMSVSVGETVEDEFIPMVLE